MHLAIGWSVMGICGGVQLSGEGLPAAKRELAQRLPGSEALAPVEHVLVDQPGEAQNPAETHVGADARAGAPWFAVQVQAGHEDHVCGLLCQLAQVRRVAAAGAVRRAFVPKALVSRKVAGEWKLVPRPLLPGYFIVESAQPEALAQALCGLDAFAQVVKENGTFKPLTWRDKQWIWAYTNNGRGAVDVSEGYVEAGVLHVVSGPLVGREAQVVKVNHRKKLAYLEFEAFGRKVKTQLSIKITRNRT